jgi:cell division protein FtsL
MHPSQTDRSLTQSDGSIANYVQFDLGEKTLYTMIGVCAVLVAIIGVACGVIAFGIAEYQSFSRERATETAELKDKMTDLQRQYRMTELKLDDWTVVAHRSGMVLPGDYTRGPQGNLDSSSFHKPKEK